MVKKFSKFLCIAISFIILSVVIYFGVLIYNVYPKTRVSEDIKNQCSAVDMIKQAAPFVGAQGGGGRPDMAQTGGADISQINKAIDALRNFIAEKF